MKESAKIKNAIKVAGIEEQVVPATIEEKASLLNEGRTFRSRDGIAGDHEVKAHTLLVVSLSLHLLVFNKNL